MFGKKKIKQTNKEVLEWYSRKVKMFQNLETPCGADALGSIDYEIRSFVRTD